MRHRKYISVFCFVFALALCSPKIAGSQPAVKESAEEKNIVSSEAVKDEAGAPAEPVPATPPVPTEPVVVNPTDSEHRIAESDAGDLVIADFESWPNNRGGEIGVFGALEPDWEKVNQQPISWTYEATSLNYSSDNVHSGKNSFRLVNGVGIKPEYTWGSFSMDLGPATDITSVPKKVESLDVSGFKYFTFWVKGQKGGEKMEFVARDAHALNYSPQVRHKLPDATAVWQKISVPLNEIGGKVDLKELDNVGIAFGKDVGNLTGDTVYLDDFAFTNNP